MRLFDEELSGLLQSESNEGRGAYYRLAIAELIERRAMEDRFLEVERRFHAFDCDDCEEDPRRYCDTHQAITFEYRRAKEDLIALARRLAKERPRLTKEQPRP